MSTSNNNNNNITVTVTGASGFLASHIVKQLLEKGYTVHGTVRDPSDPKKVNHLTSLPGASERLKLFKADLLGGPEVFNEAIKGSQIVFHSASPFALSGDEDHFVKPAVNGTLNVLQAVNAHAEVKKVVLTSSYAAVGYPNTPGHTYSEADWSDDKWQRSNEKFYALSKTLAEKAAWDYAKDKNFKLVVVNPVLITGPMIQPTLNTSSEMIADYLSGKQDKIAPDGIGFVDVRDTAEVHVRAAEDPNSEGRYLAMESYSSWEEVVGILKRATAGRNYKIPTELKEPEKKFDRLQFNNSKVEGLLGHKLISTEESIKATVADLERHSLVKQQ